MLSMGTAQAQLVPGVGGCVINGTTVTCTGDLSTGIDVDGPAYDTLNVSTVDAPGITPAGTVDGINFTTTDGNNLTIDADTTGADSISTTDTNAQGIEARVTAMEILPSPALETSLPVATMHKV